MNELIKFENASFGNSVSAHELYIGLGLDLKNWSRWYVANIEKSEFFKEGADWEGFLLMTNGNETKDFSVSIEFAKHIAMQSRSEKSHEYRNYMIDCEKRSTSNFPALPDFTNPAIAARAWADEVEAKQLALATVAERDATIERKDDLIIASNEASIKAGEVMVREFCKSNDLIDIGEHKFYDWMRDQGILLKNSREPYQKYVELGYLVWKPSEERHGGKFRYSLRITARGKVWLAAKYMAFLDTQI